MVANARAVICTATEYLNCTELGQMCWGALLKGTSISVEYISYIWYCKVFGFTL